MNDSECKSLPHQILDFFLILFNGKRIAVLGERGVGKTQLIHFLSTGKLPEEEQQTIDPQKSPQRRFYVGNTPVTVKDMVDVPGSKDFYVQWKKQAEQSDLVMYLFRADYFILGDRSTEKRAVDDLKHINKWLDDLKSRPKFFLVGTHCDRDPKYAVRVATNAGDYVDQFRKREAVAKMCMTCGGSQRFHLVLGSLKDIPSASALVGNIFQQASL